MVIEHHAFTFFDSYKQENMGFSRLFSEQFIFFEQVKNVFVDMTVFPHGPGPDHLPDDCGFRAVLQVRFLILASGPLHFDVKIIQSHSKVKKTRKSSIFCRAF